MTGSGTALGGQAGGFAYVANSDSNNVSAYSINSTTGALTPVGTFPAGLHPDSVTVDPTGQFAYVANCGSVRLGGVDPGNVSAYSIDGTTGALTEVAGSPFPVGAAPVSVTTTAGPPPPPTKPDDAEETPGGRTADRH